MAYDLARARSLLRANGPHPAQRTSCRRSGTAARGHRGRRNGTVASLHPGDDAGPGPVQRGAAGQLPVRRGGRGQEAASAAIVNDLAERYTKVRGRRLAGRGSRTPASTGPPAPVRHVAIDDVVTPPRKKEILEEYEARPTKVQKLYERGAMTDKERREELIEIWNEATNKVAEGDAGQLPRHQHHLQDGQLRRVEATWMQLRQIAGMRGLVSNPKGEIIPRPIRVELPRGSVGARVLHLDPRLPARAWPTPRCGPPTRATSPVAWSTSRRTSSSARTTAAPSVA